MKKTKLSPVLRSYAVIVCAFGALTFLPGCQDHRIPAVANPYLNCRIASAVTRIPATASSSSPAETVTVEGKPYTFRKFFEITYRYDSQGRLSFSRTDQYTSWTETTYTYSPGSYELTSLTSAGKTNHSTRILNSMGYTTSDNSDAVYTYDADGYLIGTKAPTYTYAKEISDGNLIKDDYIYSSGNIYSRNVTAYQYDLTKPNLPAINLLFGKADRSLLIGQETTNYDKDGKVLPGSGRNEFHYEYDQQGRVSRKIFLTAGSTIPSQIIDYTYSVNKPRTCFV